MATNTPNLNLKKPAAVDGVNIADINANMDKLDAAIFPRGAVVFFAAAIAPTGFLECNGALISRTTYAALFAIVGTTFGAGNGSTTFALPDLRAEFIRGYDNGRGIDTSRVFGSNQVGTGVYKGGTGYVGWNQNTEEDYSVATSSYLGGSSGSGMDSYTANYGKVRPRNVALLPCIRY